MNKQKGLSTIVIVLLIATAIGGYLVYSGKINLPQKQIDQQTTETSKGDETANWRTYINNEYGFSFKYPAEWNLNNNKSKSNEFTILVEVKSPEKQLDDYTMMSLYEVSVAIKDNKEELTLTQEVDQSLEKSRSPGVILKERNKLTVDERDAEKLVFVQDTGVENIFVVSKNKNKIYLINFTANFVTDSLPGEFEKEFKMITDQILSTFRFTQ